MAGGRIGRPTNLDASREFHPLAYRIVEAGWIQRRLIVWTRIIPRARSTRACGVRVSTIDRVFDSVVVGAGLAVHLRNIALPSIVHRDFEIAGAGAVGRIAVPDGLFPSGA